MITSSEIETTNVFGICTIESVEFRRNKHNSRHYYCIEYRSIEVKCVIKRICTKKANTF